MKDPLSVGTLVSSSRRRLRMTQGQLARRSGMGQAQVARVEAGRGDIRLSTARRLFEALGLRLVVSAAGLESLDDQFAKRLALVARRRVARVAGTMALERQEPDARTLRRLEAEEAVRLRARHGSAVWDE